MHWFGDAAMRQALTRNETKRNTQQQGRFLYEKKRPLHDRPLHVMVQKGKKSILVCVFLSCPLQKCNGRAITKFF